ncbi:YmfQ family protein [Pseudomonas sp. NPDC089554]|uniref:YmfQ family protein n=1 Tax=Pseudomonas sp. NPDC089554 TaxID=3390653 RepID=UPI003CFCF3CB
MTSLADQLRLLLPPVSYDGTAPNLSAAIEAEAKALTAGVSASDSVYKTLFPDTGEGLEDWERLLGLPDPCLQGIPQTTRQRINAVISKLKDGGGQSKAFFIGLAKSLGYEITITTFQPARAGLARAGDAINGGDWSFTWRVNAPSVTITHAAAGMTSAGDPLAAWGNRALECRLNQLKPAESFLIFGYGDQDAENQ